MLVLFTGAQLFSQSTGFLSVGYDTRFGDLYEFGGAGKRGFLTIAGGGWLLNETFKDAGNASDSFFNSRYGSAAFPASSRSKVKSQAFQVNAGWFPEAFQGGSEVGGGYVGIGYTAFSSENKQTFALNVPGVANNAVAKGEYKTGVFDVFVGMMALHEKSFYFDLRGGYGAVMSETFEYSVSGASVGKIDKPKLFPAAYFKVSLGWSW